jgi:phosphonate transport system ATP-binding protein
MFSVQNATKAYAGKLAIKNISFQVGRGEFVAVLGPSGAGKTTLFRCLAGLIPMDSGSATIDGIDVSTLQSRERRRIAVVFQQFNLVARLTAKQNVLAGRLGYVPAWRGSLRLFSPQDQALAMQCLHRVGLADVADQRADTLSGGQQQRVAIARALAQQPDVIVADEPIASLDPQIGADVLALLQTLSRPSAQTTEKSDPNRKGIAVICSLHQPEFAMRFADRLIGLVNGRVVVDRASSSITDEVLNSIYAK